MLTQKSVDACCRGKDAMEERIAELEKALKEARSMLRACGLDEPDAEYEALWNSGLAKIDAALGSIGA